MDSSTALRLQAAGIEVRVGDAAREFRAYSIHRGELQMLILHAVRAGLAIERFEHSDAHVVVELRDRSCASANEQE